MNLLLTGKMHLRGKQKKQTLQQITVNATCICEHPAKTQHDDDDYEATTKILTLFTDFQKQQKSSLSRKTLEHGSSLLKVRDSGNGTMQQPQSICSEAEGNGAKPLGVQ